MKRQRTLAAASLALMLSIAFLFLPWRSNVHATTQPTCIPGKTAPSVDCPQLADYTWSTPSSKQISMLPAVLQKAANLPGIGPLPPAATASLKDMVPLNNEQANGIQAQVPLDRGLGRPMREVIAVGAQGVVTDFYPDATTQTLTTIFSMVPVSSAATGALTQLNYLTVQAWITSPGIASVSGTTNGRTMTASNVPVASGCDVFCFLVDATVGLGGILVCAESAGIGCAVTALAASSGSGLICTTNCTDSTGPRPVTAQSECSNAINQLPPKSCTTQGQYTGYFLDANFQSLTYYVEWLQDGAVWENSICYVGATPACPYWTFNNADQFGIAYNYAVKIVSSQPDCSDTWQAANYITIYFTRIYDSSTVAGNATSVAQVECE